ncbi:MAG: precorrin-6A reductase [Lachnospiraceae bacterium]|nr:precorrin-6A reductase [Lachnospiraceae bacterium]MDY6222042.1 precorrin-6A reductase [Candidatus Alectryocaccobium sp.]
MSDILVFAGTTEGRELSDWLCEKKTEHILSVATDYGKEVLSDNMYRSVHCGRMDDKGIEKFIRENDIKVVVDATHPFAKEATENIKTAAAASGVGYLRLERGIGEEAPEQSPINGKKRIFKDAGECADALKETSGNILLTTGSKELSGFCVDEEIRSRLYVRVLPAFESLEICEKNGIARGNIIAMQGPFSEAMNEALIKEYDIKLMVTKDSGKTGGFYEKEAAAAKTGTELFIIGRPDETQGLGFYEVCSRLESYIKSNIIKISLIGCGMGDPETMTVEAKKALMSAELVFGAKRLLNSASEKQTVYPYYMSKDIIPVIKELKRNAAVLFSGDTGFYSGSRKLMEALEEEIKDEGLNAEVKIYPGISSISYLAARFGMGWEDAFIFSTHGKGESSLWIRSFLQAVNIHKKVFAIFSGIDDIKTASEAIKAQKPADCRMLIGYRMSYDDQEYYDIDVNDGLELEKEGLYSAFILNAEASNEKLQTSISDGEFIRGKVPMTKEEVREISISKLGLSKNAVVYDIGSGTGSVAVEMALRAPDSEIFAVECKDEAVGLINKNKEHFKAGNIDVVKGEAPDVIKDLPAPTHVFIGGSRGRLTEIIGAVFEKNPEAHIVINAVSLETIKEFADIEKKFAVSDMEIVSMQIARSRRLGEHHLMQSENPIWICSFKGKK